MFKPNDHVFDYVDDYLHEVLAASDAEYVERHCEDCRICKVALEEARKRLAALETVSSCEASGELIHATLKKIDDYEHNRRRRRKLLTWGGLLPAAACLAILAGLHMYYLNLSPSPYDLALLGQTELLAGTDGGLRVRLLNHKSGTPLQGIPVEIELHDKAANRLIHLARFTTNAQGSGQPRFQLPDWTDGSYELRVIARPSGSPEVLTQTVKLKRSWKLMLTSDKPVYQPGQTIHVRSLALRQPDLKPVAGQDVTFTIADPKGNVIFKQRDLTSKFGIAAIDCPLAGEIIEGPYALACKIGNTESKLSVEVKKYVLPKFKIGVELDEPYYQPGQTVHGKVHAAYFFGKPVAGGAIEIEVRTRDVGPNVHQRLNARTKETGDASFEFALPKSLAGIEQESGNARVSLHVTVTDTAGQKQTTTASRIVTANPLRIEVIPEAGSLVRDVANKIYVFVSYPDGRPAKARLAVSGIREEVTTNALGVAAFELPTVAADLRLTVRATDEQGRVGRRNVHLLYGSAGPDFLVRTDKAVYEGGETVHLVALGGGVQPVFVDFIKDGQTILTETIDFTNGRGEHQFDLPAELFGTVQLCTYRYDGSGLPIRKTRALYIRPARQLNINATLDRAEYRPGKRAKLQLTLSDDKGKPTPGALSLTAVDEAVFSVLDQSPGMENAFYLLEQQLLRPVYAIYPWSPDLTTSLDPSERNQFEQALFACTSQTVGASGTGSQRPGTARPTGPGTIPPISPHTLSANSFPINEQQVNAVREWALQRIHFAWGLFAGAVLLVGYVTMWMVIRVNYVVAFHVVGFLLCLGISAFWSLGRNADMTFSSVGGVIPVAKYTAKMDGAFPPPTEPGQPMTMTPKNDKWIETKSDAPLSQPVRVREWFPETLLWRPEVITDDSGRASIDVDLADSITTWRLMASAVSADGRLGAAQSPLRVFQPFFVDLNLPVALTRGDEVAIPVVVYNYLDKPQTVELNLADAGWFARLESAGKRLELAANEVRSTSYRLRVTKVGNHQLQVSATGSGVADALKRAIEVVPDGRRVETVINGTLQRPAQLTLSVPQETIEGSAKAILKIYPSSFSQLVEGLDAIFQRPYGCFEQTSSTTYPNILALDYLRRTNKSAPEIEAKARQYIHLGYQRLLGFEVAGGGFDWFGRPPANRTLTAYGLMEFQDMAKVHDVDPGLIERTRQWLLQQRKSDGSWDPEGHMLHDDPTRGGDLARLSTTAYIAWAVFSDPAAGSQAPITLDYLLSHPAGTIQDPYTLALVCNALAAANSDSREPRPYLERLESLKRTSEDGKLAWWEQAANARTTFYGSGRSGSIETTALAALAFINADQNPGTIRTALTWLAQQKDASGTWHSTQATVLALKALVSGTGKPMGGDQERRIEISWADGRKRELAIPADQADVMQQIDLSEHLATGENRLTLTDLGDSATGYQVAFRYHVPGAKAQDRPEPLAIDITYDRSELAVGDVVTAAATVVNKMGQTAPMVILDLPIPAGFAIQPEDLAALAASGTIAKYQVNPRSTVVYLRSLEPAKPLTLRYRLRATMPVKVTVPSARAYEYYDTDKQGVSRPSRLTVTIPDP